MYDEVMRKSNGFRTVFFLFVIPFICTQGTSRQNEGFLGYQWGTAFASMEKMLDLRVLAGEPQEARYSSNVVRIGEAEVAECDIEFTDSKFSGVIISSRGRGNSSALLSFLQRTYGDGNRQNAREYQWSFPATHIAYDEDSDGNSYTYCYSPPLQKPLASPPSPENGNR